MTRVSVGMTTSLDGFVIGPTTGRGGGWAKSASDCITGGYVEELTIAIAPVMLGGGERLFEHFDETLNLEHVRLLKSPSRRTSRIRCCPAREAGHEGAQDRDRV